MFPETEARVHDDPAGRRNCTILVVDDNGENRSILERFLLHLGYQVDLCGNGLEALEKSREKVYEMIFSDVNMPVVTGIEFLQTLRQKGDETPVVMVTGFPSITLAVDSMKKGATDFLPKPFRLEHIEHVVLRIEKEKTIKRQNRRLSEQLREKAEVENLNQQLRTSVGELSLLYTTSETAHDIQDMEALYQGFYENIVDTLGSLVMAVEAKDGYTRNHSRRVTDLAILIANEMKCTRSEMETLRCAGLIHDIGKIGIQDMMLLKPGRLDHEEWEVIRTHPVIGENIVRPLKFLKEERLIVRHHHEHFDGRGYPDGLCADEIPHLARIVALADAYDAITSTRPYRTARRHDFAVSEIQRARNTQFDPDVTDAFLSCLDVYGPESETGGIPWERIGGQVKSLF